MIPRDPTAAFVAGLGTFAALALIGPWVQWLYRKIRPADARCDFCGSGARIDTVLRFEDGEYALHARCLPEVTATLNPPVTGTWRHVDRAIAIAAIDADLSDEEAVQ